jgi:hypothetical protein
MAATGIDAPTLRNMAAVEASTVPTPPGITETSDAAKAAE